MKVEYVNYRKEFPTMPKNTFVRWFYFERFWAGKLWNVGVKHHCIILDFRTDVLGDMARGHKNA